MKVLAVDTSSKVASVAILEDNTTLAYFTMNSKQTHSQTIMVMIDNVLNITSLTPKDIDLFASATGAGSFTGLRIGISAIKGLAFGVDKPSIGVSSLEGLAYNCIDISDSIICPVMDARCGQVYNALFEVVSGSESSSLSRLCEDRPIKVDELCAELTKFSKSVIFVGDGANLCYNKIINSNSNVHVADDMLKLNSAVSIGKIAYTMFDTQENIVLSPNYLRLSQAEQNL